MEIQPRTSFFRVSILGICLFKGTFHQQDIGITWIMFFCAANGTGSTSRGLKKQMLSTQPAPVGPYFWPFLIGWLAQPLSNVFLFWKVGRWLVGGDALNRSILVIQMGITIQSPWGNFDTSLFRDEYGHGSKPIILDFWGIYIDSDPSYFHVHHVTMCTDNWNGTKVCPG